MILGNHFEDYLDADKVTNSHSCCSHPYAPDQRQSSRVWIQYCKIINISNSQKMSWLRKHKRKIGIILAVIITLACVYIILVVSAQTESSTQTGWTLNFLIVVVQSLALSPPAGLILQITLILFMSSSRIPIVQKVFSKVINKDTQKLYVSLSFVKTLT